MSPSRKVYLIGSLRNDNVPTVGASLRDAGFDVFDDWHAAGPEADDYWQRYERARGRTYREALRGAAAQNVFAFDKRHLLEAAAVVLVLPAGRSGHLEFGWTARHVPGFILLDGEPERYDVMYNFAIDSGGDVVENVEGLIDGLQRTLGT